MSKKINSNKKQKDYWTGPAGRVWVEGKNEKDNMLLPLGNALLNKIDFKSSMQVLEVGCGTGYIIEQISKKIGSDGNITGVDISETMILEAKRNLNNSNTINANCLVLDAENDYLGDCLYDLICSRFGVMFFKNPFKAFSNMNRALKNSAHINFVCWQDHKLNPWNSIPLRVVKNYIELPKIEKREPSPFAFSEKEYIYEILNSSNFKNVEIIDHEDIIELYKGLNLNDAVEDYLNNTPVFSEKYHLLSGNIKEKLYHDLLESLENYYKKDSLKFNSKTWIVSATK